MREVNKPVFICDHCNKKLFVKSAMIKHENFCFKNPNNVSACSGCIHLEEVEKEYQQEEYFDGYYFEETRRTKGFKCTKLDLLMYPFACVKRDMLKKYPDIFDGEVQMPTECEHWNYTK